MAIERTEAVELEALAAAAMRALGFESPGVAGAGPDGSFEIVSSLHVSAEGGDVRQSALFLLRGYTTESRVRVDRNGARREAVEGSQSELDRAYERTVRREGRERARLEPIAWHDRTGGLRAAKRAFLKRMLRVGNPSLEERFSYEEPLKRRRRGRVAAVPACAAWQLRTGSVVDPLYLTADGDWYRTELQHPHGNPDVRRHTFVPVGDDQRLVDAAGAEHEGAVVAAVIEALRQELIVARA